MLKNFSEISLGDKESFDYYFKMANQQVSELNFTNFFMWRDYYKNRFSIVNDFLCILSFVGTNDPYCFFPAGNYDNGEGLKNALFALKNYFDENGWDFVISRASAEQVSLLKSLKIEFTAEEDRDNFDYIYSVKKLSTLSGKKLDGKRNHINKFKKLYTFAYKEISDENIKDCKDIVEKWCEHRNYQQDSSLIVERKANMDLLENFNTLGLKGALIEVNGVPEAFTVGETLNNNTVLIHIEKANSDIHGLYPLINQQFLANQWREMEFVNREQDLGIEGLRKAKLSYNPIGFVEKYTIRLC